jgi:hypothetical protein
MRLFFLLLCVGLLQAQPPTVLITHQGENALGFYHGSTAKMLASVPVGARPVALASDAPGRLVAVAAGNGLTMVDVASRRVAGTVALQGEVTGVVRSRGDVFLASVKEPAALVVVDAERRIVRRTMALEIAPIGSPVMLDGRALVLAGRTVLEVDPGAGRIAKQIPLPFVGRALAAVPGGGIAVAGATGVALVDRRATSVIPIQGGVDSVVAHHNGKLLYAGCRGTGEVVVIGVAERRELRRIPFRSVSALRLDRELLSLFVTDPASRVVHQIALEDDRPLRRFATGVEPGPILLVP